MQIAIDSPLPVLPMEAVNHYICVLRAFGKPVGTYRTYFELPVIISHDFGFSLFIAIFEIFLLLSVGGDDINCGTIAISKALRFAQKCRICTFDPSLDAVGLKVSSARRISSVRHF